MASNESATLDIVRVEYIPDAGTCESEVYVCSDGSRWQRRFSTSISTGGMLGVRRGNQIHITDG